MKKCVVYLLFVLVVVLVGCSEVKYVPDGQYLLNKVVMNNDCKQLDTETLKGYLRQTPNASLLGWKFQVELYSLSGPDTTKRINRILRKMGDAPEIYDPSMTLQSVQQLQQVCRNAGYYEAEVSFSERVQRKKRMCVTYDIKSHEPYRFRNYEVDLPQEFLRKSAEDSVRREVKRGENFSMTTLENERQRLAERMRNHGFYNFDKDLLMYDVDSALDSHQADVTIHLRDYVTEAADSLRDRLFMTYTVKKVFFHIDFDQDRYRDSIHIEDTVHVGDYVFCYGSLRHELRPKTLISHSMLQPGREYRERDVERTYEMLSGLGPVRYADIHFREMAPGELYCFIALSPNKKQSISGEVEGTYSSGDWGVGASVNYNHRNIFHGAENLNVGVNAAHEWRQSSGNTVSVGGEVGLEFPTLVFPLSQDFRRRANGKTKVAMRYQWQKRPGEYTRTVADAGIQYSWAPRRSPFTHRLDLLEISYVYLPEISDRFREFFLNDQSILRYSFEDHLIMRMGYSGSYSTYRSNRPLQNYFTIRYGVETAGNLLQGISKMTNASTDDGGVYKAFGIRFSQYVKGDFDFVYHSIFNKNHRLVFHTDLGVGFPYGNSSSLPFEKRYYAGGATGNRGWSARTLGPGTYKHQGSGLDVNNQTGDVRFDMNLEYRAKLFWKFNGALFLDAGNIWTIRDYESQKGGTFKWNSFYKEIALAYGLGLRLDFSFFVFRVDFGAKLYDPSRAEDVKNRWVTNPRWKNNDFTWHFAIGYPF